jgi:hypothetical protein
MLLEARQVERICPRCIEPGLGAAAAVVVLADGDRVGEQHHVLAGRRLHLERDVREEIPLVEPVPVDLEGATHMGLVVGVAVELDAVDLDGAVVARRVGARLARDGRDEADRTSDHADQARNCASPAID